jgi:hypothetical protein
MDEVKAPHFDSFSSFISSSLTSILHLSLLPWTFWFWHKTKRYPLIDDHEASFVGTTFVPSQDDRCFAFQTSLFLSKHQSAVIIKMGSLYEHRNPTHSGAWLACVRNGSQEESIPWICPTCRKLERSSSLHWSSQIGTSQS